MNNVVKKKSSKWRFLRNAALVLAVVLALAHLAWHYSGSNQWELAMDKEGVKVWTLKTPGSNLLRVKAATQINSKLAGMAKLLEDLESCVDAYCYDARELRHIDSLPGHAATYVTFKFNLPGLKPRQYVLFAEHVQDPATKQLRLNIMSAADLIPRDECCVRVTHLHNTWKLTPQPGGKLDIEFTQDTDLGGVPYFLANIALTQGMFKVMHDMQDLMNKDRYRNAQVKDLQEL